MRNHRVPYLIPLSLGLLFSLAFLGRFAWDQRQHWFPGYQTTLAEVAKSGSKPLERSNPSDNDSPVSKSRDEQTGDAEDHGSSSSIISSASSLEQEADSSEITEVERDESAAPQSVSDTASTNAAITLASTSDELVPEPVREILTRRCSECHNATVNERGFDVTNDSVVFSAVTRGSAESSPLMTLIQDQEMPPESPHVPPAEQDVIRQWINSLSASRQSITVVDELSRIRADLASLPAHIERRDARYISLRIAHNRSDLSDHQVAVHRIALYKILNALHWEPRLIAPVAIDEARTLYRINLNDYGWDELAWSNALPTAAQNHISTSQFDEFGLDVAHLVDLSRLIDALTQPAGYHALLFDSFGKNNQIDTLEKLYKRIGVDYDRDFIRPPRIQRAFLFKGADAGSRVSDNFRVLDRLGSVTGSIWVSHDFGPDGDSANSSKDIKQAPWGPTRVSQLTAGLAFDQDGGEVIFSLPNGLHGFLIVDGEEHRIDVAPRNVVSEPIRRESARRVDEISNGGSCFRCHAGGFLKPSISNPIHEHFTALSAKQRPAVPTETEINAIIDQDNAVYEASFKKLIEISGESLAVNLLVPSQEPISMVVRDFNNGVFLDRLAIEMDLTTEELREQLELIRREVSLAIESNLVPNVFDVLAGRDPATNRQLLSATDELLSDHSVPRVDCDKLRSRIRRQPLPQSDP